MNKEKLVRDLVNTFNDRDELHMAYKEKVKQILHNFVEALSGPLQEEEFDMNAFIEEFVESRFKPRE
jgi:hypothetical protein